MSRHLPLLLIAVATLSACDRHNVNPPTEPAQPIQTDEIAPPAPPVPGVTPGLPGAGPASFVGRWAAQASWCANTQGPEQAITLTPLTFHGYENDCAITSLEQVRDGYEATLACQAEGEANRERVQLSTQEEVLRLTWLDRNAAVVLLKRCPAPAEPPPPTQ